MKLAILVLHARTKIGNSIRNKKRKTRQVVGAKRQQLGLIYIYFRPFDCMADTCPDLKDNFRIVLLRVCDRH